MDEIEPEIFRLNSLKDVATLISNTCNFVGQTVYFFLQISYLIGSFIVDQIINFTNYFIKFLELVNITLCILYEDSLIFFQDLGEKCIFILSLLVKAIETFIDGLESGIFSIGNSIVKVGEFVMNVIHFFFSTSSTVISFFKDGAVLIKQWLILLGSSIYLCVTCIPTAITETYNFIIQSVYDCLNKSYDFVLSSLDKISNGVHDLISFFFDLPLNSGVGLIFGLVLLFLFFISFDWICSVISHALNKFYSSLISFTSNLWSGEFLENKNKTELNNVNSLDKVNDEGLCIICQDAPKEVIYLPCAHFCLCRDCSNQIRKVHKTCPVCRKQVKKITKVYT